MWFTLIKNKLFKAILKAFKGLLQQLNIKYRIKKKTAKKPPKTFITIWLLNAPECLF